MIRTLTFALYFVGSSITFYSYSTRVMPGTLEAELATVGRLIAGSPTGEALVDPQEVALINARTEKAMKEYFSEFPDTQETRNQVRDIELMNRENEIISQMFPSLAAECDKELAEGVGFTMDYQFGDRRPDYRNILFKNGCFRRRYKPGMEKKNMTVSTEIAESSKQAQEEYNVDTQGNAVGITVNDLPVMYKQEQKAALFDENGKITTSNNNASVVVCKSGKMFNNIQEKRARGGTMWPRSTQNFRFIGTVPALGEIATRPGGGYTVLLYDVSDNQVVKSAMGGSV